MTQYQSYPIYALPYLYISGLNISVASTTVLAVSPGQCRDSNNIIDMPVGLQNLQGNTSPATLYNSYMPPLFINSATTGANGLDAGAIAASTQYAVYLIGDSSGYNNVAAVLSLTSNAYPSLPAGYDSLRLIGFIATDASSHFVYATSKPQWMSKAQAYGLSPAVAVTATNATSFTAIDLNAAVPTATLQNVIVTLAVTFIPAAVGDYVQFRPSGSSATAGVVTIMGAAAGIAQTQYIQVIAGQTSSHAGVDYLVSSSSDLVTVSVVGYTATGMVAYPS